MKSENSIEHKRHSLAHLLAAAVLELYPDAKPTLGPAIENGFYYDFEFSSPVGDAELKKIEKAMKKLKPIWHSFERIEASESEALDRFKDNPYKQELVVEIVEKGEPITLYKSGEFVDLCRGGHVEDMKEIENDSWKLSRVAGAYWRGDEKNTMLTRIYGLAFDTVKELEEYETMIAEAEKRDHKKLGKELGLFVFSPLVGGGLPLWTPKGAMIYHALNDYVWSLRKERGFERVVIPHITKKDLYETSGHWDKFKDELFRITTREGHEFAMKPMNCPHHTQIFDSSQRSYRDMPQRYAETTMVYRDEQSGELSGLSRVRSITQDDAHVFCRENQIEEEMNSLWNIVDVFYGTFGFNLTVRFSRHDPENFDKYIGTPEVWKKAEEKLGSVIKARVKDEYIDGPGEAAMYGPKVDFMAKDALGRTLQVATIQLDYNMPTRFELTCVNEKGEREPVVMIHCAIMGSIERFMSTLIEHYAGTFPLWLSPVQVKVLPIGESHIEFAREVYTKLKEADIRAELDDSSESLGKKIRNWKTEKAPYALVIGDQEIADKKVTLESRDPVKSLSDHGASEKLGTFTVKDLLEKLQQEIESKA